jgi:hypothetical protein
LTLAEWRLFDQKIEHLHVAFPEVLVVFSSAILYAAGLSSISCGIG